MEKEVEREMGRAPQAKANARVNPRRAAVEPPEGIRLATTKDNGGQGQSKGGGKGSFKGVVHPNMTKAQLLQALFPGKGQHHPPQYPQ